MKSIFQLCLHNYNICCQILRSSEIQKKNKNFAKITSLTIYQQFFLFFSFLSHAEISFLICLTQEFVMLNTVTTSITTLLQYPIKFSAKNNFTYPDVLSPSIMTFFSENPFLVLHSKFIK